MITAPNPGATLSATSVRFEWVGGADEYALWVGTTVGGYSIWARSSLGTATAVDVTGLPIDGRMIYVRLHYRFGTTWSTVDYAYIAATVGAPTITAPVAGSTLTGNAMAFHWNPGADEYALWAGASLGTWGYWSRSSLGTSTSAVVDQLPLDGSTVFVRFWYRIGSLWSYADSTYTACAGASCVKAYRHTLTLDGAKDFNADETFTTTSSPTYASFVTWDSSNLYIGYQGPDIANPSATKWLLLYFDVDPQTTSGAVTGVQYNTQTSSFPNGFNADYHLRWKTDGGYTDLMRYSGGAWSSVSLSGFVSSRSGDFVEMRIPLAALGGPPVLSVEATMINEAAGGEWTYAGLDHANFIDGYYGSVPLSRYLAIDMTAGVLPNAAGNLRP
jgi:hypothetical protein